MSRNRPEVIIVGSGLGGLSAALHSVGRGCSVTVVEAASDPGGKAGRRELEGVEVDTGPSVLTLPEAFESAFSAVGERFSDHVTLRPQGGTFDYRFADGRSVRFFHDFERTRESVRSSLGAAAGEEVKRFLEYADRIWDASAPYFVFADAPSFGSVAKLGPRVWAQLSKIDPWRSMWAGIESHVRDPYLRTIFARYATYNGSNVLAAPATLNCIAHVELGLGGYGVEGGIFAMVRAIVKVAESKGVTFRYEAPVAHIETSGGQASGVRLESGERLAADAVIANCDSGYLHVLLGWSKPVYSHEEAPSMSGWTAVVKARRRSNRPPHQVLFPNDYLEEFRDIFERGRCPVEPTVYVCADEQAHGRSGWAEHEPLFVMANAPALSLAKTHVDTEALERKVWDRLRQNDVVAPDDTIVWRRGPDELAGRFPGSQGAIYGVSSNSMWSAFRRPSNRVPGVKNVYLASGSAHPGGGMPLVTLSGRAAARSMLDDLRR